MLSICYMYIYRGDGHLILWWTFVSVLLCDDRDYNVSITDYNEGVPLY